MLTLVAVENVKVCFKPNYLNILF